MEIVDNFYNKVLKEIDSIYFPDVKYYMDDRRTMNIHRIMEHFNNGCVTYDKMIKIVAKNCKDTEFNINKIVSKYIVKF